MNEDVEISDDDIQDAAHELEDIIARTLGDLANRILGRPELGTDDWHADQRRAQDDPGYRAQRDIAWYLTKLRIARAAGTKQTGSALNARKAGATWTQIGEACGISKQAAYDRWASQLVVMLDDYAQHIVGQARLARSEYSGHPSPDWPETEQLAVALVLRDREWLDHADLTPRQAEHKLHTALSHPPADLTAWLAEIRDALGVR